MEINNTGTVLSQLHTLASHTLHHCGFKNEIKVHNERYRNIFMNIYINCFQKLYPCSSTISGHAVDFASTFCKLYTQNRHRFSSHGQRWLDAVRKCPQVGLVPFIRLFAQSDCKKIKKKKIRHLQLSQCAIMSHIQANLQYVILIRETGQMSSGQ